MSRILRVSGRGILEGRFLAMEYPIIKEKTVSSSPCEVLCFFLRHSEERTRLYKSYESPCPFVEGEC